MRKFLLIAAMVMFALPTFAQNYELRLASIYSEEGMEAWDYVYSGNDGVNLVCINEYDMISQPTGEYIDSIFYDERGNITRLATWQKYWGSPEDYPHMAEYYGKWIYSCYVDYEYDENNNLISRKNYNDFYDGWGPQLGGDYSYKYDEEGRMIEWSLKFIVDEYQKAIIEYDEEGRKISETIQQYNFSTYYLENAFLTEYEYDENGNCVKEAEFEFVENEWQPNPYRVYEYDESGNCILSEQRTLSGTVNERKVYAYDTETLAENVYYYPNPEQDYPALPEAKVNLLKSFEFHALNDANELTYVTTYLLDYDVVENNNEDDTTSVQEVAFASSVYPNPAQDYVMVESSEADYVEVVDVFGRVVFATEMNESVKVDMSEFASGIYFVKLQANGATSVQKVVKK